MIILKFDKNLIYQKVKDLTISIYTLTSYGNDFGFKNQTQRASVSFKNIIVDWFIFLFGIIISTLY